MSPEMIFRAIIGFRLVTADPHGWPSFIERSVSTSARQRRFPLRRWNCSASEAPVRV